MVEGDQLNPGQLTMTQVSYDVLELLELPLQILFGGIFSQLVVAPFLVAPLERVKVLLQVNLKASSNVHFRRSCKDNLLQDYIILGTPRQVLRPG